MKIRVHSYFTDLSWKLAEFSAIEELPKSATLLGIILDVK